MTQQDSQPNHQTGVAAGATRSERRQSDLRRYEENVERDYRWNLRAAIGMEFFWGAGLPFASYGTVVPAYLTAIDAPKALIGVIASLLITLCPLQLLVAHRLWGKPRKRWLLGLWTAAVAPWAAYSIAMLIWGAAAPPLLSLVWFCVCMFIFAGCITCGDALLFALLTDCTPLQKRGVNFGLRLSALAVAVISLSPVALWMLRRWPEPVNFLSGFLLACVFYVSAGLVLQLMREHVNPAASEPPSRRHPVIKRLLPQLRLVTRKLRRDPNYRVFLFFTALLFTAMSLAPFIVVYAREELALSAQEVLYFTIMLFVMGATSGLINGRIGDRWGYRFVGMTAGLLLSASFMVICAVTAVESTSRPAVYAAFCLYAAVMHVLHMMRTNLSVELRPREDAGMLTAVASSAMAPAILVVSWLGGYVIDHTHKYTAVFAFGAALALVGTLGFALLVREPRGQRMYVIKTVRRP